MDKLIIKGARIIDPTITENDTNDIGNILIVGGRIAGYPEEIGGIDAEMIDASGLVCSPGLVDMHVHLRDPGQTHKEDIQSGCNAAAAGGVTSLACMPNTDPVCDSPEVILDILSRAASARARVYPVGAITKLLEGAELTDFGKLRAAGAVGLSDDGRPVTDAGLMKDALRMAADNGLKILSHSEELSLARGGIMNLGRVSESLGVPGIDRAAEDKGVARDIEIAALTGLPIHICHVSTRGSVAMLREARKRGVRVTGETAPHYFMLDEEMLNRRDADYRMNPPLRTRDDVQAVIEGLCDGTISAIATDHAPHSPGEKADFEKAPNGVIGLETSLAAGITALVKPGHLTLPRLIALMSSQPADILGISAGTLSIGAAADIVIFAPDQSWTVEPNKLYSKSRNTPFKGMELIGRVRMTLLGGRIVYRDGKII